MYGNFIMTASLFWLFAGMLIGVAATISLGALWKNSLVKFGRKSLLTVAAASALTIVAVSIYAMLGRPDLIAGAGASTAHAMTPPDAANADAKSMAAVAAQLAERLARDGGNDSDWQLLAQSYEFMGRVEDAARAREHSAPKIDAATVADTAKSAALIAAANTERLQRQYPKARASYEAVIKANGMTADSWADYADVLASSQQGTTKLSGAPAQAVDKALALNPNHAKALWLKASLAHEEHRYADALIAWERLRSVIGDNESDARIIDANIAEAKQLADAASASSPMAKQASTTAKSTAKPSAVSGTIEIDPKLLARAAPGATLFIFAKTDSPGPPLAVFRTTVATWPVSFKLDDSMAMLPGRNLSSATDVIVEARISKSGQATAATGDLQAVGTRVKVRDGKAVRLRIDKVVS